MKILLIGFIVSLILHSALLINFNLDPIGDSLPIGTTVIGKVRFVEQKTKDKPKLKSNKKLKEQKIINKDRTSSKELIANKNKSINNNIYINHLRRLIEKNKRYPFSAKKMKITGVNEVQIKILKNGKYSYRFVKYDESEILNKATKDIFENIPKFEPLPEQYTILELTIPIVYKLTN